MLKNNFQFLFYRQLRPQPSASGMTVANWVIVFLILSGFVLMAVETESGLPKAVLEVITYAQIFIVLAFALEFSLRLWAIGADDQYRGLQGRLALLRDPLIWMDFFAFAPELIILIAFPSWGDGIIYARALRFLRLLKLFRYIRAFDIVWVTLRAASRQLAASFAMAGVIIYVSAYALYFAEGKIQPENFGSVPRALWWSVATLTTVGYGDVYPITPLGKILAAFIALVGVAMVALPAGILASTFQAQLHKSDKK
jgi:voltage-gated potassium channel